MESPPESAREQTVTGSLQERTLDAGQYVASLPERLVRTAAVGAGGLVHETSEFILPPPVRRSQLYQSTVGRMLRIIVEFVGGVASGESAESLAVRDLAVRKLAGNAVEMASVVAVGWSPLWLLAAAADVTGGTRAYLDAFVKELKESHVLAPDADVSSVDDLLAALEGTSGQMADTIDIPPLALNEMRTSLGNFRQNAQSLPDPRDMTQIFAEMNRAAAEQNRSLFTVSSLVAAGAIQAGIQLGNVHLFSFYRDSLSTIRTEGVPAYLQRISQPYLEAAAHHLRPSSGTHTQRLLGRFVGLVRRKRNEMVASPTGCKGEGYKSKGKGQHRRPKRIWQRNGQDTIVCRDSVRCFSSSTSAIRTSQWGPLRVANSRVRGV